MLPPTEQEEIIEKLEEENARIAQSYTFLGTAVVGLSSVVQIFILIGIIGPRGLTAKLFSLLHLALHAHAALVLHNRTEITIGNIEYPVPPLMPAQLAVVLYPMASILIYETVEWASVAAPVVAAVVVWMSLRAIQDGKVSINQLETLKYTAKGA